MRSLSTRDSLSGGPAVEPTIEEDDDVLVVDVELEENDILRDCAGKCGQKILDFGMPAGDWGDSMVEGAFCLECRSRLIASGSLK